MRVEKNNLKKYIFMSIAWVSNHWLYEKEHVCNRLLYHLSLLYLSTRYDFGDGIFVVYWCVFI